MTLAAVFLAVLFVPVALLAGVALARSGPAAAFAAGYAVAIGLAALALWAADVMATWRRRRARGSAGGRA